MRCSRCGAKTSVKDTRDINNQNVRWRRCTACHYKFETIEMLSEDAVVKEVAVVEKVVEIVVEDCMNVAKFLDKLKKFIEEELNEWQDDGRANEEP